MHHLHGTQTSSKAIDLMNTDIQYQTPRLPTPLQRMREVMLTNRQPVSAWIFCSLLILSAGCSTVPSTDYSNLGLVDVSGKITLDGEALVAAVVTFENSENGQFSFGQTDSYGKYTLQLDSVKNGVTPGTKVVRISTTRKILGLNDSEDIESAEDGEAQADGDQAVPEMKQELVPDKYNRKSELTVEVSASDTTFDFDLTSK